MRGRGDEHRIRPRVISIVETRNERCYPTAFPDKRHILAELSSETIGFVIQNLDVIAAKHPAPKERQLLGTYLHLPRIWFRSSALSVHASGNHRAKKRLEDALIGVRSAIFSTRSLATRPLKGNRPRAKIP